MIWWKILHLVSKGMQGDGLKVLVKEKYHLLQGLLKHFADDGALMNMSNECPLLKDSANLWRTKPHWRISWPSWRRWNHCGRRHSRIQILKKITFCLQTPFLSRNNSASSMWTMKNLHSLPPIIQIINSTGYMITSLLFQKTSELPNLPGLPAC